MGLLLPARTAVRGARISGLRLAFSEVLVSGALVGADSMRVRLVLAAPSPGGSGLLLRPLFPPGPRGLSIRSACIHIKMSPTVAMETSMASVADTVTAKTQRGTRPSGQARNVRRGSYLRTDRVLTDR